jgi:phosphomannomutase
MPGAEGMQKMQTLMNHLRTQPPRQIAGLPVTAVRDYLQAIRTEPGRSSEPYPVPQKGDMLFFDLADPAEPTAHYAVAVRPSGTEPKVKFYLFAYQAPDSSPEPEEVRGALEKRLSALEAELKLFVENFAS